MTTLGWNILVLSFALYASAQVAKECSAPPQYPHTRVPERSVSFKKFRHGQRVTYSCAKDFTPASPKGDSSVQCLGGKWTKLALKCEKRSCVKDLELPNGKFTYGQNTLIGQKVYAVCEEGYTLKGRDYMVCKSSGWAGEFPSCVAAEATCSTPAVANSVSSAGDVSVHRLGDSMNFICSQGFQLKGAQQITCGPGGVWQPQPPQCLPKPREEAGQCRAPVTSHNSNANMADRHMGVTSFPSGSRVQYVCNVGYVAAGGSRYRSCHNGEWSPLLLKCERKSCGSAGEILHGEFTYTGVQFGDTAKAVCNEGYDLVGRATRRCTSDGWDGRVPTCEVVVCEEPTAVTNAVKAGPGEPPYTYRAVIRYGCRVGTLIGQRDIWCTKDGTWSGPPPTCKEITCPPPNVPNAFWMGAPNRLYRDGDTVSVECNPGYTMTGWSSITCERNGQWSDLPKCTPAEATCSTPAVANSVSSAGDVSVHQLGDSMSFICSQGFQLKGAQQITCGPGGVWQPQPPQCLPKPREDAGQCRAPVTSHNSNANMADRHMGVTSFPSGSRVQYVCNVGYVAAGGSRYRSCHNGEWSPLLLKCERKSCGSAGEILHGEFTYTGVQFGDTAKAVCNEGYDLVGRATRRCTSDGWDGRVPTCEVVVCEEPTAVTNAVKAGPGEPPYTYRAVIRYGCRVGTLIGQRDIWCTKDGTWSGPPPTCKEITCPPPNVPNAYWMGTPNRLYRYGDTISVECDPGYTMTGWSSVTCERNGQWSDLPKCTPRWIPTRRTDWRYK